MTREDTEQLFSYRNSPLAWAESLLSVDGKSFRANTFQKELLLDRPEFRLGLGYRRSGKTLGLIIRALHHVTNHTYSPVIFISVNPAQALEAMMDVINENEHIRRWVQTRASALIKFQNRSFIQFYSLNQDLKLRGQSADLILIDEGDAMPDVTWKTLAPILYGDKYRDLPPFVLGASSMVMEDITIYERKLRAFGGFYSPADKDKEFDQDKLQEIKEAYTVMGDIKSFDREYLCKR